MNDINVQFFFKNFSISNTRNIKKTVSRHIHHNQIAQKSMTKRENPKSSQRDKKKKKKDKLKNEIKMMGTFPFLTMQSEDSGATALKALTEKKLSNQNSIPSKNIFQNPKAKQRFFSETTKAEKNFNQYMCTKRNIK